MSDKLSQSEIDALLLSMADGGGETIKEDPKSKKEAIYYDFARPTKINKEQLRTLEIMHDSYCRGLASFLSAYLRTKVSIDVLSAEEVTYSEFSNSLSNPSILSIVEFKPLKGSIIMELGANLGYAIIDRILGGPGSIMKKMRDFSEIEKILLEKVIIQMLNPIPSAWNAVENIQPFLEKIETNAQFAQIVAPTDMTALITMSIKIGDIDGLMNFCLPISVIDPIIDRLNTRFWFSTENKNENDYRKELEDKIETANISISAVVGRTRIMVSDFVNLGVGDIIPLDSYVNTDLEVLVGSLKKFLAKPGISRGKNAIQITELIESEV